MKLLLIALILSALFCIFSIPFITRAYARTWADEIIHGHHPTTEDRLNACISFLTLHNKLITTRAQEDLIRIRKLRDMFKEMQHPHG